MISDKKLQSLAVIISEDWDDVETPTDVYTRLVKYATNQKEYFHDYLKLNNFIKLVLYIYYFKTEGTFDKAIIAMNNLEFVTLLMHDGENYDEECDNCNGNGSYSCNSCGGDGTITCPDCDGEGNVECNECDGDGEIETSDGMESCQDCNGNGRVTCDRCDGNEYVDCIECDGSGENTCWDCDGRGSVETDEFTYSLTYLINWNPELKYRINKTFETMEPTLGSDGLINFEKNYIITDVDDNEHAEFEDEVEEDKYYTIDVTDEPERPRFQGNGRIRWNFNPFNLDELTT